MKARDLALERTKLTAELDSLSRAEKIAEEARRKRQERRDRIIERIGQILDIIMAVGNAIATVQDLGPTSNESKKEPPRIKRTRRSVRRRSERIAYGTGVKTIRKILPHAEARGGLTPAELEEIAARDFGIKLNAPSLRSALRRMVIDGEVVKNDGRYMPAHKELPLEKKGTNTQQAERRSDA